MPLTPSVLFWRSATLIDAEHEGADQHEVQQRPHVGERIERAQLGNREKDRWIVEADHRPEADEAERGGEDAADPAGAEVARLESSRA